MNEGHNSTGNLQKRALKKTLGGLSVLSAELVALAGQAISLRGQIDHIERGLEDEEYSDGRELTALYSAMGRVLPGDR
jgi:hypothetical protein